jgi:hypothetical protein
VRHPLRRLVDFQNRLAAEAAATYGAVERLRAAVNAMDEVSDDI